MEPQQHNYLQEDEEMDMHLDQMLNMENPNDATMEMLLDQPNPNNGGLIMEPCNTKAFNVPASSLQIGLWIKKALHDDCIRAKLYFKKSRMAWEVLMDDNRKVKFEVKFNQISALRTSYINTPNSYHGVLEIALNEKPKFFQEKVLKEKKHADWETVDDFTNGKASSCMKHILEFDPRWMEKLLERIHNANTFLSSLINQPFPVEENTRYDQLQQIPLQLQHHDHYYSHMDGVNVASSSDSLPHDLDHKVIMYKNGNDFVDDVKYLSSLQVQDPIPLDSSLPAPSNVGEYSEFQTSSSIAHQEFPFHKNSMTQTRGLTNVDFDIDALLSSWI